MSDVIPHWLLKQASLKPNGLAIELETGEKITFKELNTQSQKMAKQLANLGMNKGDHVALLSHNDLQMAISIHALSYLGVTVVLLNTRLSSSELQYQINDADVSIVIAADGLHQKLSQLDVKKKITFQALQNYPEKDIALQTELKLSEPFTIIYTSGTTGFPKGVIHTYGNHWWSAMGSALNLGLSPEDKWLAVLPLFHVSGLSILLKSAIYGMPMYLMTSFEERQVHAALMTKGITMISVVTVMLQKMLEQLGKDTYPDYLRCVLLGGGPAPQPILEQAKEKQVPVFQSYGLTETSSQIATLSAEDALNKLGSAGKPLVPAQLKIIDRDSQGVGDIHVKGPMVTKGYFKNEAANQASFHNGWLKTGDLGYFDEDEFLYIVDRRSDLIISGGENIYPSEIESVITGMEAVKEVGVTGQKNATWGEVPVAFIVKHPEKPLTDGEVKAFVQQYLASYKVPQYIYFIEELPRNASNKIMRHKLSESL